MVLINGGAVQRSMVTSVQVFFNEPMQFKSGTVAAFKLEYVSGPDPLIPQGIVTFGTVTLASDNKRVELTFNDSVYAPQIGSTGKYSLIDGRYKLTVVAANAETDYDHLDGDNDGYGGNNFTLSSTGNSGIFRIFGDGDGSALVDGIDFGAFRTAFNTNNFIFDYDGSGVVDGLDFGQFRQRFGVMI